LTSQSLAFDIVARNAIQSDPNYHQGQYHDNGVVPANGLAIARMLGHITYLSRESMMKKFDADRNQGRKLDTKFETKFSVGSYLAYQGERFVDRFDANSYITISTAIDNFNLGNTQEELKRKLRKAMCRWLILSFSTDWLFPPFLSKDLTAVLLSLNKQVNYCNIPSEFGHDAFLLPNDFALYGEMIRAFLADNFIKNHGGKSTILQQNIEEGVAEVSLPSLSKTRFDFNQILDLIPLGASVLDLGCGGGELLTQIRENSNSQVLGLEISEQKVLKCIGRGIDVVQADLNYGLNVFEDDQFDFVILSKTLQTITDVELVLSEMLRVGTRCIVSFPNLGYNKYRRRLSEEGRAPCIRHGDSPEKWYNTEDVRFLTLADFEDFCEEKKIRIHYSIPLDTNSLSHITENPNQNADVVIMVISR
jgi:homoserine O-acetyltransferase